MTQQKALSTMFDFFTLLTIGTSLVNWFAAYVKLSAHTFTHNDSDHAQIVQRVQTVPILVFCNEVERKIQILNKYFVTKSTKLDRTIVLISGTFAW